jgi:hypothetical protein
MLRIEVLYTAKWNTTRFMDEIITHLPDRASVNGSISLKHIHFYQSKLVLRMWIPIVDQSVECGSGMTQIFLNVEFAISISLEWSPFAGIYCTNICQCRWE